jgi:hypothetical protein
MKLYFISGKHFECKKMGAGHVRGETLLFVCAVLANTNGRVGLDCDGNFYWNSYPEAI